MSFTTFAVAVAVSARSGTSGKAVRSTSSRRYLYTEHGGCRSKNAGQLRERLLIKVMSVFTIPTWV